MKLDLQVDHGPGHIVLDGDPAPNFHHDWIHSADAVYNHGGQSNLRNFHIGQPVSDPAYFKG